MKSSSRFCLLASLLLLFCATASYAGQFNKGVSYRVCGTPVAVAIGDFNGDLVPDIATACQTLPVGVVILLGNGDGTFHTSGQFPVGKLPSAIATGDFNGDGKLDLTVVDTQTNVVYISLGKGNGSFGSPTTLTAGQNPLFVAVADLNNDGKLDLVVAFNGGGPLHGGVAVLLGNGDGTFQSAVSYAAGPLPNSVAVGDVNGDGIPDVVASNGGMSLAILLGKGDGTFQSAKVYTGLGLSAHWVALGDFNNDGKTDVAAVLPGTTLPNGRIIVGLGNGDGTFAPPAMVGSAPGLNSIAAADFTKSGYLDLAVAEASTPMSRAAVYMGNGNGTFQSAQLYPTNADSVAVAAEDLNGDGYPDLVVASRNAFTVTVLLNVGTQASGRH